MSAATCFHSSMLMPVHWPSSPFIENGGDDLVPITSDSARAARAAHTTTITITIRRSAATTATSGRGLTSVARHRHRGDAERRARRRGAQVEVVGDAVDALEQLVEVARDRDLGHRERQLAALDPEALRPGREAAGHGVEPKA